MILGIFLLITGAYIGEIFIGLSVFTMNSSKLIWVMGGIVSGTICYVWYWFFNRREKRSSFVLIAGIEIFFIGASLLGFGTAYIFIEEKDAYSSISLWPLNISIKIILQYCNLFIHSVGLELIPLTIMISIPVIGTLLILISYPLCFKLETRYWPRIALASSIYLLLNVFDYAMTINGILSKASTEGNPIIQKYIDSYGLLIGVFIHKLLICSFVIFCVILITLRHDHEGKRNLISESLLYWGSVITLIAVSMWITLIG